MREVISVNVVVAFKVKMCNTDGKLTMYIMIYSELFFKITHLIWTSTRNHTIYDMYKLFMRHYDELNRSIF